jgi:hypothetical protein
MGYSGSRLCVDICFATSGLERRLGTRERGLGTMRPSVIIILAVLIGALLIFDTYEYNGHYSAAAWEQAKKLGHDVENLVGGHGQ